MVQLPQPNTTHKENVIEKSEEKKRVLKCDKNMSIETTIQSINTNSLFITPAHFTSGALVVE